MSDFFHTLNVNSDDLGNGRDPPDLLELNMSEESESAAAAPRHLDSPGQDSVMVEEEVYTETESRMEIKQELIEPVPGTSQGNFFHDKRD